MASTTSTPQPEPVPRTRVRLPVLSNSSPPVNNELARALVFVHERLGARILEHHRLAAHVYALTETLIASGALELRTLEQRKQLAEERMLQDTITHWEGARVLTDESDKYEQAPVTIDCAARLPLCKAACCRLSFHLSKQDLAEGRVRWDVGRPYHIAQRADGWCTHCHPKTRRCEVHEQRPKVCRSYDCRHDQRIWVDFEARQPNPQLASLPHPEFEERR